MSKHLFFDLDDTLIKCSADFYEIEDIVSNKILEYSNKYSFKELKTFINEKQIENTKEHSYGPQTFECSLMQVAYEVIGYNFFKDNIQDYIKDATKILYTENVELIDGVEETIKYLYDKGYKMSVLTKGMESVQKKRFEALAIRDCFDTYYIVKHKMKSDYEEVIKKHSLNPTDCYMIGNSPKGDINAAKLAGLNTIFIPNESTWSYEEEEIINDGPETKILSNITEMKKIF